MDRAGWPQARAGMAVGLLGGSFDPPHAGHVHITHEAMKRFGLDRVWWLVSPGNPLKARGPAPMAVRIAAARGVLADPRVVVTGIEAQLGTRATVDTLGALMPRYPGVRFVWLMGADNLAGFHRWERWQDILRMVPVGVIARPGSRTTARNAPAVQRIERFRLPVAQARLLPWSDAPAWCFVNVPMVAISSTELRRAGGWPGG
jgi:nicotinate-nucleotide adenylyltransferase